jgi:hypothetical protein
MLDGMRPKPPHPCEVEHWSQRSAQLGRVEACSPQQSECTCARKAQTVFGACVSVWKGVLSIIGAKPVGQLQQTEEAVPEAASLTLRRWQLLASVLECGGPGCASGLNQASNIRDGIAAVRKSPETCEDTWRRALEVGRSAMMGERNSKQKATIDPPRVKFFKLARAPHHRVHDWIRCLGDVPSIAALELMVCLTEIMQEGHHAETLLPWVRQRLSPRQRR